MNQTQKPEELSRRHFLDRLLEGGFLALLAAIIYPIIRFIIPPQVPEASTNRVVAANLSELPVNSGKIFRFGDKPGIVLRTAEGQFKAFSAICTHLDCTVQYRSDLKHIWCACHNGHYDLNGKNVAGPPPRPLEEYQVYLRGEDLIVSKT
ncbi:MAG: plastoquinol--plastocyanin reductase [candidate division Zixibacteria bacterium RBG_16_48_11]|nr:MAG: plastoquinol--plastocyanin reductase [candidate division Zixibacteria bacterium RBG_16_48_11]